MTAGVDMSKVANWDETFAICEQAIVDIERASKGDEVLFRERLHALYEHHADRFLADAQRVWQVGAVLIPASGAGLFAAGTLYDKYPLGLLCMAVASICIIVLWHCIAEQHNLFQATHSAWLQAIEKRMGVAKRPKSRTVRPGRVLLLPAAERGARLALVIAIVLIWVVIGASAGIRLAA
jgi:hypothetical protein